MPLFFKVMDNGIKIFRNERFGEIRTAGTSEEPLFCLADICKAVDLTNPSSVKSRLDSEDVQLLDLHALNYAEGTGNTTANFVTESGFYDVILQSSSLKVKPFRRWITSEVLPSIRKTGEQEPIAELIKITEHNGERVVSARELHKFLESKQEFANWMKNRIEKYGLVENVDYEVFDNFIKNPNGGRPLTEYALTIDAAKELSMVEGNERGKLARKYFIACEKRLKEMYVASYQIEDPIARAQRWIEEQKEKRRIEKENKMLAIDNKEMADKIAVAAPKVAFANAIEASKSSCLIGELAKILTQNGFKIGQNRLFQWMRNHGFLGTKGERYNVPNQQYVEQGLFELKKGVRSGNDGVMHTTITTKVTGKGQSYFINKFIGEAI